MKMAQDLTNLLEKLYNLKGEDNVIIAKINKDIKAVEDKIVAEAEKQSSNELSKVETESQLSIFVTQKEAFCSTFTGIDNDTFGSLNAIGVNLDIASMLERINEKAPMYCDELNHKIEEAAHAIDEAKKSREEYNEELNKLNDDLTTAKGDRERLISLLEQSLSPNVTERESLTAKYAKDVISKFNLFSSTEIAALAKVILFPEDGLIEFDETYDEKEHPSFNDEDNKSEETEEKVAEPVLEITEETNEEDNDEDNSEDTVSTYQDEPEVDNEDLASQTYQDLKKEDEEPTQIIDLSSLNKSEDEDKTEEISLAEFNLQEEEPITLNFEDKKEEELITLNSEDKKDEEVAEETSVEKTVDNTEEKPEEKTENEEEKTIIEPISEPVITDQYAELKSSLENIGLDIHALEDNNELLEALSKEDTKHIEENYEILRSINVNDSYLYQYIDNYNYLIDSDLNKKLTLLRAKGISEHKLKELLENYDSGLKEDYQVLEQRVNFVEENNNKLSDDNVYLLTLDVNKYNDNINVLNDNGFEIDDKDLRNYQAVLYKSNNVKDDVEVLKNYLVSIQRKNGKYALGVFFKNSKELLFDIDDVIEAKLEDLLDNHPEVLANRVDSLIARTKYVLANNESLYEDEENGIFNKNVIDGLKFYRTYHQDVNEYMPRDRKEVNRMLESLLEGSNEAVQVLDKYYEETTLYKDIELTDEEKGLYNNLKALLEEKLNIVSSGTHTYLVNDIAISKNKLERNLAVLVKDRVNIEGMEKVLILSAMLYNLRQPEEVLKQIIDSYDKDSSKDGGAE